LGLAGGEGLGGAFLRIQAQAGLALAGVGAVAGEAGVGEDGAHVAVELDGLGRERGGEGQQERAGPEVAGHAVLRRGRAAGGAGAGGQAGGFPFTILAGGRGLKGVRERRRPARLAFFCPIRSNRARPEGGVLPMPGPVADRLLTAEEYLQLPDRGVPTELVR